MNIYSYKKLKNIKTINWCSIYKNIFKLQTRVVKQLKKKNFRKVRNLQRLILKSFGPKLLASQKLIEKRDINKFNRYKKNTNDLFLNSLNLNSFIQIQDYNHFDAVTEYSKNFLKFTEINLCLCFYILFMII